MEKGSCTFSQIAGLRTSARFRIADARRICDDMPEAAPRFD
jgi:hypothetical protein